MNYYDEEITQKLIQAQIELVLSIFFTDSLFY
jgi:hypothetical protein